MPSPQPASGSPPSASRPPCRPPVGCSLKNSACSPPARASCFSSCTSAVELPSLVSLSGGALVSVGDVDEWDFAQAFIRQNRQAPLGVAEQATPAFLLAGWLEQGGGVGGRGGGV